MPHARSLVQSKTFVTPSRCYEKARLDQELKLVGEFGLRNKREVWRVKLAVAKVRKVARTLLTLDEKDPKRLFEGNALLRRLVRIGVLTEDKMKVISFLDFPNLTLNVARFRACPQDRGLPRATTPDPGLQARTRQVHPPRPSPHPTATHPCPKAGWLGVNSVSELHANLCPNPEDNH